MPPTKRLILIGKHIAVTYRFPHALNVNLFSYESEGNWTGNGIYVTRSNMVH